MKRKIKQIAASAVGENNACLFALAEDGSCWKMIVSKEEDKKLQWEDIPALPDTVSKGMFESEK